jgi:hypothetical protein
VPELIVIRRNMPDHRELLARVHGQGAAGGAGVVLVYRLAGRLSIVVTEEENGDAEVLLEPQAIGELLAALERTNESTG